jgi:ribose 1,5-bisphosphate isomerase
MHSEKAAREIRALRVQGARNIAIAGLNALEKDVERSRAKSVTQFGREVSKYSKILAGARPTEPALRNGLAMVQRAARPAKTVLEAKQLAWRAIEEYAIGMQDAVEKIVEVGVKRIKPGMTILTHCHSSTVSRILGAAWRRGTRFSVICTETRPFNQGRLTARDLLYYGIPTTLIVDSAVRYFLPRADLTIVGADAVTADGHLVNKIGTSAVAALSREARVPFAVACETFKFDPLTLGGEYEPIEQRDPHEVWASPPKRLKILNPAFDVTHPRFISYMITEQGIISPYEAGHILREKL